MAVAGELSDYRRPISGALGLLHPGHRYFQRHPTVEDPAFVLEPGQHSAILESVDGFHILYRDTPLRARELRIAHRGAVAAPVSSRARSKDEAQHVIAGVLRELEAGADLVELIRRYSESPTAESGGDMGVFGPGQRPVVIESTISGLAIGARSDIVETPFGFAIYERLPLADDR
jgi:parvulin-like peptidyl-prolyl isomerase